MTPRLRGDPLMRGILWHVAAFCGVVVWELPFRAKPSNSARRYAYGMDASVKFSGVRLLGCIVCEMRHAGCMRTVKQVLH